MFLGFRVFKCAKEVGLKFYSGFDNFKHALNEVSTFNWIKVYIDFFMYCFFGGGG